MTSLSGRRPPSWTTGIVDDFVLVGVDFGTDSAIPAMSQRFDQFFGTLLDQVKIRNPNAVTVLPASSSAIRPSRPP